MAVPFVALGLPWRRTRIASIPWRGFGETRVFIAGREGSRVSTETVKKKGLRKGGMFHIE